MDNHNCIHCVREVENNAQRIDVTLSNKTCDNEKIVTVEYSADQGLRAYVYEDTDLDSEPTIIDLNQYIN